MLKASLENKRILFLSISLNCDTCKSIKMLEHKKARFVAVRFSFIQLR